MDKIIQPWGWTGNPSELFEVLEPYDLRHGAMSKVAACGVHPDLFRYVDAHIRPNMDRDRNIYILASNMGAGETWGCFPADTAITMADGTVKAIQNVQVEDRVLSGRGISRSVLATQKRPNTEELIEISVKGSGSVLRCTPNHPLAVIREDEKKHAQQNQTFSPLYVPASDVGVDDYVLEPIPVVDGVDKCEAWVDLALSEGVTKGITNLRSIPDTKEHHVALARLLGYYTAEGCLYKGKAGTYTGLVFVCGEGKDEVGRIVEAAQMLGLSPYITHNVQNTNGTRIQIQGIVLARICNRLIGHGAKNKFLHHEIINQPKWWLWEFLGAYFDGDGSQERSGKGEGTIRSSSASIHLTTGVVKALSVLGVPATWHKHKQHESAGGSEIYPLSVGKLYGSELSMYVRRFSKPCAEFTTTSAFLCNGYIARPVKSVRRGVIVPYVYNIEVEHDHSYIAQGFSVANSNINADLFSRPTLSYNGEDWGIQTFKKAGIFAHHNNKNPEKSYGNIPFVLFASALDGYMDRVESVVVINIEKAIKEGQEEVVNSLKRGDMISWSMGARVKYDVCVVCGNKAKNRGEYCQCMKRFPNQVLTAEIADKLQLAKWKPSDYGKRICVDNPQPRFFDFSRVWVGAAPEAKTLQKIASARAVTSAELADMLMKSAVNKEADIEKRIEGPGPIGKTMKVFSNTEPSIPNSLLNSLGFAGLPQALSTCTGMGMILRPREFRRIVVVANTGRPSMADDLDSMFGGMSPSTEVTPCHSMMAKDYFVQALAHMLLSLVKDRSTFAPVIRKRMIIARITPKDHSDVHNSVLSDLPAPDHPFLNKIAALYNGYRLSVLNNMEKLSHEMLANYPTLVHDVLEDDLLDRMAGLHTKTAGRMYDIPSVAYWIHAHGFEPSTLQSDPETRHLLKQAASLFTDLNRWRTVS